MTDQIPMRSASERREAAARALAKFDGRTGVLGRSVETLYERELADALRPLLEVPEVGITEDEIVAEEMHWLKVNAELSLDPIGPRAEVIIEDSMHRAVRAAERAALEHWEPADVPSQEFMLRHLGIEHEEYDDAGPMLSIPQQYIQKEVM